MSALWVDLEHRDNIADWLNAHELVGDAAEVGCAHGGFARLVLSRWKGKKYYMVDPWISQPTDVYRERTDNVNYEQWWRECMQLAESDKRITILRKFSVEGAVEVPDQSLCFCHIDGNHSYQAVLEDLDAWYPKMQSGGVFSGDDYGDDTNYPNFCEVKRAVDRWAAEHHLTFTICRRPAWWIVVP